MSVYRRPPPLESLRVFEACARHSNFSRAAFELGVTPTAVSLRIRALEGRLGVQLFDRHGPKVTPSAAGTSLARTLSAAFASIGAAIEDVEATAPPLRVTVVPTVAAMWLLPRLGRYQALPNAAQIKLDVATDLRPVGAFDLAIRSGSGGWPGLRSTFLFPDECTPMLSPDLAASVELRVPTDLARLPFLADDDWPLWFAQAGMRSWRQSSPPGVEYPTQDLAAAAAVTGAGVALLSPTLFASMLADGRLVQPFPHIIRRAGGYHAVVADSDVRSTVFDLLSWLCAEAAT